MLGVRSRLVRGMWPTCCMLTLSSWQAGDRLLWSCTLGPSVVYLETTMQRWNTDTECPGRQEEKDKAFWSALTHLETILGLWGIGIPEPEGDFPRCGLQKALASPRLSMRSLNHYA